MVAAFPLQAGRRAPAADPVAEATGTPQAAATAEAAEAAEEVSVGPMSPAVWSEPAPVSSTSAGAGQNFHSLSRAGGAAQVAGPAVHSTTPAVGGERAVFRGSAL